ncbi:amino acid ABC transporter permease [Desulfatirhabdium butyrativorans]|uniref:amino acid ABC transporter permease n=1 Tax=Desulfatirhabdium butyrativorans TaxID=340467 RepID=UPI0009FFDF09|nr:amino acid ABC transporter permease [Desulfatirhabdium butyrativorans]
MNVQQPAGYPVGESIDDHQIPFWHNPARRALVYQLAALIITAAIGGYLFHNTVVNLKRQSIATGFGFLEREASFEIGESPIPFSASQSYARALLVGLLNTIKVAVTGVCLSLVLGLFVGICRLSGNWLVARLAALYIEVFQDIPVLLQLFFWYAVFYDSLPPPRLAITPLPGVFLCNRGLIFAVPQDHPAYRAMAAAFLAGCVIVFLLRRWARKRQERTGRIFPVVRTSFGMLLGLPFMVWAGAGFPVAIRVPQLSGFNFSGGMAISPEFTALLLGLVLYTAAFVAEIVRAGIQAVSKGQSEAAMAIGLKPWQIMNLVILPQALRIIIPPLTSQMMNLTKNSSLAVAIGYPDFVSVASTTINQTGQAIEGVAMIMVIYLIMSLITSAFMNWYNRKKAIIER